MYWSPMLENLPCAGLFAAMVTPTGDDARLDLDAFDRVLDFLLAAGVSGICLGGATGEYPHFETAERKTLIQRASSRLDGKSPFVVGVGGPSIHHVLELGRVAMDAGSLALLLPMPMFFRYEQEDLDAFVRQVARGLDAPWLLLQPPLVHQWTRTRDDHRSPDVGRAHRRAQGQQRRPRTSRRACRGARAPLVVAARWRRSSPVSGTSCRLGRWHLGHRRVLSGDCRRHSPEHCGRTC